MSQWLLFNLYLTVCLFKLATSQCPVTSLPDDWTAINIPGSQHCYALAREKTDVGLARDKCWSVFRGHLARFHDVTSVRTLSGKLKINTNKIWIDLVQNEHADWSWSDGSTVDSKILELEVSSGSSIGGSLSGALTNDATPKFSKWTSDVNTAKHEFLCQTPKVIANPEECGNSSFKLNGQCYHVSTEPSTLIAAAQTCGREHKGHLAPLENTEVAVAVANYFHMMGGTVTKVWVGVSWNEENNVWEYSNGRKVTVQEENWSTPSQKIFTKPRSAVVLDLNDALKWKTRKPDFKMHFVCEPDSAITILGKALKPISVSPSVKESIPTNATVELTAQSTDLPALTSTSSPNLILDMRILGIVASAVGVVFFILLVVICILCYKKKKCCVERKEVQHTHSDGFGTPVSFDFLGPEDGNGPSPQPISDTPARELPRPPIEENALYATINDNPTITTSAFDSIPLNQSTLSLASRGTLPISGGTRSFSTLPRLDISPYASSQFGSRETLASREGLRTPGLTSFGTTERNPKSPYYAQMKRQRPQGDNTALQYAELTFNSGDEDQQFAIDDDGYVEQNNNTTNQNSDQETTRFLGNGGSVTQQRFFKHNPAVLQQSNRSVYENEKSPFVVSPDSPQFPFEPRV